MAELVDALDSGSSGATRTGSSPATRTMLSVLNVYKVMNTQFLSFKFYQVSEIIEMSADELLGGNDE